ERVPNRDDDAGRDRSEQPERRAAGRVGDRDRRERAGEQDALEADLNDPRPLGPDTGDRRTRVRRGNAERLGDHRERDSRAHAFASEVGAGRGSGIATRTLRAARLATDTSTMTIASSTFIASFGTWAFTASPACSKVPNKIAASTMPLAVPRPSIATAIPAKP